MRTSRKLAVAGLIVALAAGPSLAGATITNADPVWHTGCLRPSGNIVNVAPGNTPRQPCATGETRVDINNGDLTNLTAGPGIQLRKGSTVRSNVDRGAAQVELSPSYQLPQGCTPGAVPKRGTTGAYQCAGDDLGRTILGRAGTSNQHKPITNGWGSITKPLRLPAGTWAVSARIGAVTAVGSPDDFHLSCRLLTDGSVTDFQTIRYNDRSGVLAWYEEIVLVGVVSRPTPMEMHIQCKDDKTEGAAWETVRVTATEQSSVEVQELG